MRDISGQLLAPL